MASKPKAAAKTPRKSPSSTEMKELREKVELLELRARAAEARLKIASAARELAKLS